MFHHYHLYGLHVQTTFPFSFLDPVPPATFDVTVSLDEAAATPASFAGKAWHFQVDRQEALLFFRDVATFHLLQGQSIRIIPQAEADRGLIEQYLLGTVFGVLLFQRNALVVHASSVMHPDGKGAILFMGESGAGKSSLALAMQKEFGCAGLSDDVVGLDCLSDGVTMRPAYPFMKLSAELAELYSITLDRLGRVPSSPTEYFYPYPQDIPTTVLPLAAIFVLRTGRDLGLVGVRPAERMVELVRHSIPARLLHRTGDAEHFNQCAAVARTVPMYFLTRTSNLKTLPVVASKVAEALGAS